MKCIWLPLVSALALTACEVDAAPNLPEGDDSGVVINQTAALNAYPGASNSNVIPDGLDTRTTFAADASLQEVYNHFHGQLTAQGWGRTNLENDDKVEAEYTREGRELEFELERDGGGFELEIDIDGDNSTYDEDNGPGDADDDDGNDDIDDGADDGADDTTVDNADDQNDD